jgi:hypothetical protein
MSEYTYSEMEEVLARASDIVESEGAGVVHYCWTATAFTAAHRFIRGDKLMLNVVCIDDATGDTVLYQRAPALHRSRSAHYLQYSSADSYRVMSGKRKGFVVSFEDLRPSEDFQSTGLHKVLEAGPNPWNISLARRRDRAVLPVLEDIADGYYEDIENSAPSLYLTIPASSHRLPFLRERTESVQWLRDHAEYRSNESVVRNLYDLRDCLTLDAGEDREAWPYEHFQGSGVVAASPSALAQWYRAPASEVTLPHIRIALAPTSPRPAAQVNS